jgi:hypothetical protein
MSADDWKNFEATMKPNSDQMRVLGHYAAATRRRQRLRPRKPMMSVEPAITRTNGSARPAMPIAARAVPGSPLSVDDFVKTLFIDVAAGAPAGGLPRRGPENHTDLVRAGLLEKDVPQRESPLHGFQLLTNSGPQSDPRMLARRPAPCFEFFTSEAGHEVFNREGAVLALSCRRPE